MESSGPLPKASHSSSKNWGEVIGTLIAVLTLILPLFFTTHYSKDIDIKTSHQQTYVERK